jgi:dipeptidyl aminopeptidase/acylaminoacyl peptidase
MSRALGALFVCLFWTDTFAAEAGARRFDLADLGHLVQLADPQVAPDGRSVVLVVSRANEAENRYDPELVSVDLATRVQRKLTFERQGLSSPRFSPAGDRLAFLAAGTPPSTTTQVYVMSVTGGDARRVTAAARGVSQFAWRPDGATLAFIAEDETIARIGAARFDDAFEVGNDGYLTTHAPAPSHLWLVSADGGEPRRLTAGTWSLGTGLGPSGLSWSPDGREVAFCRTTSASAGDSGTSQLSIVDVTTGDVRSLDAKTRGEANPRFSPRGGMLLYTQHRDGDPANLTEAYVAPAGGGAGTVATRELDRSISWSLWMPDGRGLLVGGNDGGRVGLWEQPLGGVAHRVELGPIAEYTGLAIGPGERVTLVGSEAGRPPELYTLESLDGEPRRLTDFNLEIASRALGRTQSLTWKSSDGHKPDGILTLPPDARPGKAQPLVLVIHGGPTGASNEAFDPLAQLLAARGFAVFQPNYRGSDNLGNAFQRAIVESPGEGIGKDVLSGIAALKKCCDIDPARIGVSGWSFGGFVTVWLIGHSSDFAAAVAGAAALDFFDMWSLSDLGPQRRHALDGSPWTRQDFFTQQSPLTSAARIRTPTLILSNSADQRFAVTQSFKLFRALKGNGVEARLVVYPTGGHLPAGPVRQRDVYRRWLEWMETHLTP